MKVDPRSIREEGPFLELLRTLDDAAQLRARLIEAGTTPAVSAGLVSWLIDKRAGRPDRTTADTRARYRRILRNLGPDPRGRQAGRLAPAAAVAVVNLVALVAVAAGSGHPQLVAGILGLLDITWSPAEGEAGAEHLGERMAATSADVIDLAARRAHTDAHPAAPSYTPTCAAA